MGQNKDRPVRDTSAQKYRERAKDQDPKGQDKALRAMEDISHVLMNPGDDEGPEPGTDLYYEMLRREGVPQEAVDKLEQPDGRLPAFRHVLEMLGQPQDDEFYGQDVTPETIRTMDKREPWVLPNINKQADLEGELGAPHWGYEVRIDRGIPNQADWERRYLSVEPQPDIDPRYRQLLLQLLGSPQR